MTLSSVPTLDQGDVGILQYELYSVRSKWYNLGMQLRIPTESLDCIQMENLSMPECLLKMLTVWLKCTNPPPTWDILTEVLESPSVGEGHLAQQLRDKYCQRGRGEGNHAWLLAPYSRTVVPTWVNTIISLCFPPRKKSINNVCTSGIAAPKLKIWMLLA